MGRAPNGTWPSCGMSRIGMHRARNSTVLLYKYADPGTLYKETGYAPG
jgi:hypothetical protein